MIEMKSPIKKPLGDDDKVAPSCVGVKTPGKKPMVGQKKRLAAHGVSSPMASKKQKVSEGIHQSIEEEINDVAVGCGVDYLEEQEMLLAVPKKDSRALEAAQRTLQQEEEKLLLQKNPFLKKVALIISKCGIKHIGSDVALCLSVAVEWRLRGLITELIRQSKQRVDTERLSHQTIITLDVRHQILLMNQTEDQEKKSVEESQKLWKPYEAEGIVKADADGEFQNEDHPKSLKSNKEENDDKMKTVTINIASCAAVGADDILFKRQLMAEQPWQKCDGVVGMSAAAQSGDEDRSPFRSTPGSTRIPGREIERTISVKDIIAVLENDHHMSKSDLLYLLYLLLDRITELEERDQPKLTNEILGASTNCH